MQLHHVFWIFVFPALIGFLAVLIQNGAKPINGQEDCFADDQLSDDEDWLSSDSNIDDFYQPDWQRFVFPLPTNDGDLGDVLEANLKLSGVHNYQDELFEVVSVLDGGSSYYAFLAREPNNPHDPNAVAVIVALAGPPCGRRIGYIDRDRAQDLSSAQVLPEIRLNRIFWNARHVGVEYTLFSRNI